MFGKKYLGAVVLLCFLGAATDAAPIERKPTQLMVGQQISVPAKGVVKYSEGVQGIVDVRLPRDGREFIVVGIKPGASTLLLIYDGGRKVQYDFTVRSTESAVPKRENIRLDFYFVELSNSENLQLGVNWPATIGGGTLEGTIDLAKPKQSELFLQIAGPALPRLDILQSTGHAKVARQTAVITANGTQAKFESGGEVNIAVQGSLAAELRQIEFGSSVQVLPRYDQESGRIEMTIEAEFSSLAGGGDVPGRSVSNVNTIVNVDMGQAVILAGLKSESKNRSKAGLPLLSQIPVLGTLFGSHGVREEHVQNVLFIVPSVVDLVGAPARARVHETLELYREFHGDFPDKPLHRRRRDK